MKDETLIATAIAEAAARWGRSEGNMKYATVYAQDTDTYLESCGGENLADRLATCVRAGGSSFLQRAVEVPRPHAVISGKAGGFEAQEDALSLICFPYAGGNASCFDELKLLIPAQAGRIVAVEYPGHGRRRREKCLTDRRDLVVTLVDELMAKGSLSSSAGYCLLGYSMGALVASAVAMEMKDRGLEGPRYLFALSEAGPPDVQASVDLSLPDDIFVAKLLELGEISREVAESPEAGSMLGPYRADLHVEQGLAKSLRALNDAFLECQVLAIRGSDDAGAIASSWSTATQSSSFEVMVVSGPHMFIHTERASLCCCGGSLEQAHGMQYAANLGSVKRLRACFHVQYDLDYDKDAMHCTFYFQKSLPEESAHGFAADVGQLLSMLKADRLKAGLSASLSRPVSTPLRPNVSVEDLPFASSTMAFCVPRRVIQSVRRSWRQMGRRLPMAICSGSRLRRWTSWSSCRAQP